MLNQQVRVRSRWWYLLPIFFSIIGGVITYFILKDEDPKKAKNCLWLGIVLIAVEIGLFIIFVSICTTIGPCADFNDEFMRGMEEMMAQQGMMGDSMMSPGGMMGASPIEQHEEMLEMMEHIMEEEELRDHMLAHMIENQDFVHNMFSLMDKSPELKKHMEAHVTGKITEYETP